MQAHTDSISALCACLYPNKRVLSFIDLAALDGCIGVGGKLKLLSNYSMTREPIWHGHWRHALGRH